MIKVIALLYWQNYSPVLLFSPMSDVASVKVSPNLHDPRSCISKRRKVWGYWVGKTNEKGSVILKINAVWPSLSIMHHLPNGY